MLRLVVLNSCEGARTTLTDPYAGVATTLVQLGVPAVVAMQFEISDRAAIVFAEELYTNLIGRRDPIELGRGGPQGDLQRRRQGRVGDAGAVRARSRRRAVPVRRACTPRAGTEQPPVLDVLASVTHCPWPPPQPVGATLVTVGSPA